MRGKRGEEDGERMNRERKRDDNRECEKAEYEICCGHSKPHCFVRFNQLYVPHRKWFREYVVEIALHKISSAKWVSLKYILACTTTFVVPEMLNQKWKQLNRKLDWWHMNLTRVSLKVGVWIHFCMKRLRSFKSFQIIMSHIKKSKTYSGWCPFQGLSNGTTLMKIQSGRTVPLRTRNENG